MLISNLNDLITTKEVCDKLKINRSTFENMKKDTKFPTPYRVTGFKGYRYSESEILNWLISRKVKTKKRTPNIKHSMKSNHYSLKNNISESDKRIISMLNKGFIHGTAATI